MTRELPLVSVVMANYNTPEVFLRAAIESILGQTYQNLEFIIVDDASTENDVEIIKSYHDDRIILLQNECNKHISYSANRGMEMARGKYIARMDSDDVSLPYRIEKQVRFLQRRTDIDVLCSQAEIIGVRRGVFATKTRNYLEMRAAIFFTCPIINPTVMFKASFIKENAFLYSLEADHKAAEDYELWTRFISVGKIHEYPQVLIKYRTHRKQISVYSRDIQTESTNHLRKNMLSLIGITPSSHEIELHYYFCTEGTSQNITLKETEDWTLRLIAGNKQYKVFDEKIFKNMVLQHFFVIAIKFVVEKRMTLRQVTKLRLGARMLLPIYYPGYISRYVFSRRLNRHP